MKISISAAATALLLAPVLALAQQPARTAGTQSAKAAPARTVAKRAAPVAMPAAAVLATDPLSAEQLAIAADVHTGAIACELGASVVIEPDAQSPGRFHIQGKGFRYHLTPTVSSTGAVRLEDRHAGAVWLQIANKSMLMNQKLGQRMADECMSERQNAVAQAMKIHPPQSLFDTLAGK